MMIGGSTRIDRLETRVARLEDLLRQFAMMLGIEGVDRELARTDEPPAATIEASAISDHRAPAKRR